MSPADELRAAAARMRELATAAPRGEWACLAVAAAVAVVADWLLHADILAEVGDPDDLVMGAAA